MQMPEMLDNVSKTVKDDLAATISKGDKLSVAAACFSIYACILMLTGVYMYSCYLSTALISHMGQ